MALDDEVCFFKNSPGTVTHLLKGTKGIKPDCDKCDGTQTYSEEQGWYCYQSKGSVARAFRNPGED
tara:strand:- start:424 stop:621 length:198 start_codon:yes stop_codon:yes gene_type:complete